jgi:beta-phosphoglucomutase
MKNIAIIFDLDGVIVTTDRFHYEAWKEIANREGIYFDETINHKLRGVSRMESLNIILENAKKVYSAEEKLEMATTKNSIYVKSLENLTKDSILDNVVVLLEELIKRKIKIAIGSSSKNAKRILKQVGLFNYFDVIVDGNDIKNSKPDPEVFLVAAKKLGVAPSNCYVVEDAEAGIIAAKEAKMIPIAISDATKSSFSKYKIENVIEILKII